MKCKLQQPIKDFILAILVVTFMFSIIFIVPALLGMLLVYLEIGLDIFSSNVIFDSPYDFYLALGAYWVLTPILGILVLFLGVKILQGIYYTLFSRRVIKNWFKENIYNCEGN